MNYVLKRALIKRLKNCPVCKKGKLEIAVDAVVYFDIDADEHNDIHYFDNRELVCTECGANSDDNKLLKKRFKEINEVL